MGALGDVLELAATSSKRWTTVQASVVQYCHNGRQQRSIERNQPAFLPKLSTPPGDPSLRSDQPVEQTTTARLAAKGLERLRVDTEPGPDMHETSRTVQNPSQRWTQSGSGEVHVTDLTGPMGAFPDHSGWTLLLSPSQVLEHGEVESLGENDVAGRPTLRARVRSRLADGYRPMPLRGPTIFIFAGWFGDETLVDLDAATGIVLRLETFIDGELLRSYELRDIRIDEPLADEQFDELPPADAVTTNAVREPEPIEAVAAQVSFTLFVLAGSPSRAFITRPKPDAPPVVFVHQFPESGMARPRMISVQLLESASSDALADPVAWEAIEVGARPARI